jgi:transcriptional regulator with XRE-family HTH domain
LAKEVGMPQNAISRLESPNYGRPTLTTLRRLAGALDVGLIVHFVPFSQLVDWVSGTPRIDHGLSTGSLEVPSFEEEDKQGIFDDLPSAAVSEGLIAYDPVGKGFFTFAGTATGVAYGSHTHFGAVQFTSAPNEIPIRKPIQSEVQFRYAQGT